MKTNIFLVIVLAFIAASCNMEPSIDHLRVCNNPDYDITCPSDNSVLEASETDTIYVTATMSHVPQNTEMVITWFYLEDGETAIDDVTLKTDEEMIDMPVYSYLSEPNNGWPLGSYKVKIDLKMDNFTPVEKVFSIE
ncbi:MAG: hypothetical protein A2W93_11505 [Bacteroidetes bacterium GWF2_43_63]|nr:MAG: hypothetical protein A2W94_14380 [Bacteroidetes bacterium GWE2_42_42]OFY54896.1 MAG: hypothetical protein A2W93_11505 [Bacteroidetes bacterium GWF2_43_63]HCB63196.1 hypothetical protein [Bacteroidales bacterium]HCY22199.1 hypothetical protein [Bacteroidales bacterium]